jgi:hypothetical protein
MVIQEHKLNVELSKQVYDKCRHVIKKKQCYNNAFNVINFYGEKFSKGEWKIAYGYVEALKGRVMARHAFILDEDNKVIDPTLLCSEYVKEDKERIYISFKVFKSLEEYLDTLEANDGQPALFNVFFNREIEASKWAMERNMFII